MPNFSPVRLFEISVKNKKQLSPHMMRITFTGSDLHNMCTYAPDQRVKLLFPTLSGLTSSLPEIGDWYEHYQALSLEQRPVMRIYTIRHLRALQAELDIDFVLHGDNGPASSWAFHSTTGDSIQIIAPHLKFTGKPGGFEWRPPHALQQLLLAADATAIPAALGILDELSVLPSPPESQIFFEVESAADKLHTPHWPGLSVQWLIREKNVKAGSALFDAVRKAKLPIFAPASEQPKLDLIDIDQDILWEVFEPESSGFYGWIAGEAGAVMQLRKYLISECHIPKNLLNLMGYWRYKKSS